MGVAISHTRIARTLAAAAMAVPVLAGAAQGGCSSPDAPRYPPSPVDCVAVLGAPPASPQMLRGRFPEGVPYSGLDRSKLIGQLTDDELSRFCDYLNCVEVNGYSRALYEGGRSGFEEEGLPLAVQWMATVVPFVSRDPAFWGHEAGDTERGSCMDLNRKYFASCAVGATEDCMRENACVPFGLVEYRPSCPAALTCSSL